MDDDNDDWLSAAAEPEPEPEPAPVKAAKGSKSKKSKKGEEKEAPVEEAPVEEAAPEPEPVEEEPEGEYLDPDKLLLFKHWIRPRYIQYKYIYDYRRSYYDDVIAYIESRRKGYRRNIPRPQTWAQRVLRTYNDPLYKVETFDRYLEDIKLVTRSEISGRIYSYQNSENFNKRYTTKISRF